VPDASLSETGTLPGGVTFTDNGGGTATLAGTPASGSAGSYPLTLAATNGVLPAASQSFTLTVDKATPTLSTTASADVTYGGGPVSDAAAVAGGVDPAGTVSFALYGPADPTCAGSPVYTDSAVSVTGDGSYPSGSFTPTAAGTYAWRASYSGDANNAAVTAACGTTGETVTVAAVASSPPTGVGASISAATTTVTVTWTAPGDDGGSPVGGYQVFRSTTPGQQGTLLATVTATTYTYTDTTAVPGITYFYAVVTVTAGGFSPPSQEVSATIPLAGATGSRFATTPDGGGWWIVHPDGGVFSYGTAAFYGSLPGVGVKVDDIVGIDGTPDGKGYWLVGADGGVFSFGDARFYGSMAGHPLNQPVVGIASTPDGRGYWLVASDGGVFSFGDAAFYGSTGAIHLNKPMVGIASTPDGTGYWLVASDGGVFAFGSARFYGSTGNMRLNRPVVGMAATPDGTGYWLVASDGGIFTFGDAGFFGSLGDIPQTSPVVGMAPLTGGGYQLIHSDGSATRFAS